MSIRREGAFGDAVAALFSPADVAICWRAAPAAPDITFRATLFPLLTYICHNVPCTCAELLPVPASHLLLICAVQQENQRAEVGKAKSPRYRGRAYRWRAVILLCHLFISRRTAPRLTTYRHVHASRAAHVAAKS